MGDLINHPDHYTSKGIEPIDYIEAHEMNFNCGNVIKYVTRAGEKVLPGETPEEAYIRDMKKAAWYCQREVERVENRRHLAKE